VWVGCLPIVDFANDRALAASSAPPSRRSATPRPSGSASDFSRRLLEDKRMSEPIVTESVDLGSSRAARPNHDAAALRWTVPVIVLALCLGYFLDPNPRLDLSAFDTRDAEGYLALSRSLVTGHGYTRSLSPEYFVPHTTWPPGLPILLMPAALLAGLPVNLLLIKLATILYGVTGIVLAHLYARRVSRSPLVQLAVPMLLALNPYYWQFSRMTNSEMPAILWALIALLLADIGWMKGMIRPRRALAFGLISGFGMLIRGSLYGALFLPLAVLVVRRPAAAEWRPLLLRVLAYAAGFLLPFLIWTLRNRTIDSSKLGLDGINQLSMIFRAVPVDPSSPMRTLAQIFDNMFENTAGAIIYPIPKSIFPALWSQASWDHLGAFAAPLAIAISVALLALSWRSVRNLPIILLYGSTAALNVFYAAGSMMRLWVPVACLLAISLPIGAERLSLFRRRGVAAAAVVVLAACMAANLGFYIVHHDEQPYHDANFAALADMFKTVRAHPDLNGNVLTPNPEAFSLYTGLHAPMTVPGIGVEPEYSYVILPSDEWNRERLSAKLIAQNRIWSLIALATPLRLAEIRQRNDCPRSMIPAGATLWNCLIW
jgi:hypothetical protein